MLKDILLKNDEGNIILSPAGKDENNNYFDGDITVNNFENIFPDLANATVPLADTQYQDICDIDEFWKVNAEKWRAKGLI